MKNLKITLGLLAVVVASQWQTAALADDGGKNSAIRPPGEATFDKTNAQWSEAWWQWCFSLHTANHPLFDTGDCSVGQSGKVWFLGGSFASSDPVVRDCTIPKGTYLFFPILNFWADNTGCPNTTFSTAELWSFANGAMDSATEMSCTIDGVAVKGLADAPSSPYRVQTPSPNGFSYTLPSTDNILTAFGLDCYSNTTGTPITVSPVVGDGYYLMLKPLPVGKHTLHFHGAVGAFVLDVTYHLTVSKK
jgi:hypothetical protein